MANPNTWKTPRERDLGLRRIENHCGLSVSVLPNGALFAIEHRTPQGITTQINQLLGSPLEGGIGRILLRAGGERPFVAAAVGPGARAAVGFSRDRVVWESETEGVRGRVTLSLEHDRPCWVWQVEVLNRRAAPVPLDAILVQDIGLASPGFLSNNEAYASQYTDHHVARHPRYGPVVMSRQNLAQGGKNPWIAQGCLDGAVGFATDGLQLFGPGYREQGRIGLAFGEPLPGERLQHELACAAIQSPSSTLEPGTAARWRFFALYEPDHPLASSDADLVNIDALDWRDPAPLQIALGEPVRTLLQDAPNAPAIPLDERAVAQRYPERFLEERAAGRLLSFFAHEGTHNRHIVLRDKETRVTRRHGTLLRSGQAMLPDEETLCATVWMHGVFGAQLTVGNTSFNKILSVSRDPYNITRASGLRILFDGGRGWQLLAVPSAFDMGLSDARWIYCLDERVVTVHAIASGEDAGLQWRITVDGSPCRLLLFGHLVLGEREFDQQGVIESDVRRSRFTLRPDPQGLWGSRYPDAVFHLVTEMPELIEAIGGDELLYTDGQSRCGPYVAILTRPLRDWRFAITGSLGGAAAAERLAAKYEAHVDDAAPRAVAAAYWKHLTRGVRITAGEGGSFNPAAGEGASFDAASREATSKEAASLDAIFPWLAHNAMVHLTVPHGLEQYTGAAWGTRDVCQGPVEFLLALEHDEPVKEILRRVFAQQYQARGDWPQWFMLEPYSAIQDRESHGDVIVWPLKALNDYVEATGDLGFLDEPVAWRDDASLERTARTDSVVAHIDKLLTTVVQRFIPGTHLIRYGEGDWNDSLQPVDDRMRDWMVSAWTVALLYQQINRYVEVLRRAGRKENSDSLSGLADEMRGDFNRFLIRDDTVAGYALFEPGGGQPELLIHPCDQRTGLRYALLPMTRGIIGGMFTPLQAQHHLRLIREHLQFPDGVRLMDRPVDYRGGPQQVFRRAESSSYFGREIGLMYVHAHLRYGEAMAVLGEVDALWEALQLANPIAVTDRLAQAAPRQRNAYFSSSDAAFHDRYEASRSWSRVRAGTVPVEGGWRIYSSGPGLYVGLLIGRVFGRCRRWGRRAEQPSLPAAPRRAVLSWDL